MDSVETGVASRSGRKRIFEWDSLILQRHAILNVTLIIRRIVSLMQYSLVKGTVFFFLFKLQLRSISLRKVVIYCEKKKEHSASKNNFNQVLCNCSTVSLALADVNYV